MAWIKTLEDKSITFGESYVMTLLRNLSHKDVSQRQ